MNNRLYDPVTGRPSDGKFDPETGEPIQLKFDPHTGEPMGTNRPIEDDISPMTVNLVLGKPSYSKAFGIVAKATRSEQDEDYVRAIELYFSASDMLAQLGEL
jgi:hypothetical protein